MTRKPALPLSPFHSPLRPATGHDPLEGMRVDGMIVTGACQHNTAPAFKAVLLRAVERVSAIGGHVSLYVYGSVATGTACVGRSDVDLFTVGLSPAIAARTGQDLSAEYAHLCRGVDIAPAQLSDYDGPADEAYGNRVFLRHYCVHLAGPDLGHGLPDFPADKAAARGFNGDIGLCADRWRVEVLRDPYPGTLGRRVARKTLLAIAGLVSVHDAIWTTDRVAAAWRWGMLRPALAGPLRELVGWCAAGPPGPTPSEVQIVLDGVVADVVGEFRQHIGLWR
jgi:hypothetical protein